MRRRERCDAIEEVMRLRAHGAPCPGRRPGGRSRRGSLPRARSAFRPGGAGRAPGGRGSAAFRGPGWRGRDGRSGGGTARPDQGLRHVRRRRPDAVAEQGFAAAGEAGRRRDEPEEEAALGFERRPDAPRAADGGTSFAAVTTPPRPHKNRTGVSLPDPGGREVAINGTGPRYRASVRATRKPFLPWRSPIPSP